MDSWDTELQATLTSSRVRWWLSTTILTMQRTPRDQTTGAIGLDVLLLLLLKFLVSGSGSWFIWKLVFVSMCYFPTCTVGSLQLYMFWFAEFRVNSLNFECECLSKWGSTFGAYSFWKSYNMCRPLRLYTNVHLSPRNRRRSPFDKVPNR